mmetsp:Transcript_24165/g.58410  ORF Transcript_24165/g.58410 Transcript_24165/m.58410 type:complete len:207 (-) Transcript_24165:258-878(-)|eukprot:CAMPEP_0114499500 /NCGR_PEP_ID=MMETSP0109-20121206/7453_1 /TAXON_ID=29199 /ORGANISM="Chlorarachnion reptans, Strain CCCM449" /LENGTH=206 /DNA_ID=CAMNT_0001677077 /DNA_START=115 /DNA_END=735 /DNA_ORIENTATION=-
MDSPDSSLLAPLLLAYACFIVPKPSNWYRQNIKKLVAAQGSMKLRGGMTSTSCSESDGGYLDVREAAVDLIEPPKLELQPIQGCWYRDDLPQYFSITQRRVIDSEGNTVGAIYKQESSGKLFLLGKYESWAKGFTMEITPDGEPFATRIAFYRKSRLRRSWTRTFMRPSLKAQGNVTEELRRMSNRNPVVAQKLTNMMREIFPDET